MRDLTYQSLQSYFFPGGTAGMDGYPTLPSPALCPNVTSPQTGVFMISSAAE